MNFRVTSKSMTKISIPDNQKYYTLVNKTSPYKNHFQNTNQKQSRKSNVYQLATSIYHKQPMDSLLSPTRVSSSSVFRSISKNPQQIESPHLKKKVQMSQFIQKIGNSKIINNLNEKTLKVPQYTEILMNLGSQKKNLLKKIQILKNHMARQNTLKYNISMNCRKHLNKIEALNENINKLRIQINKTIILQDQTSDDVNELKRDLDILNEMNENRQRNIQKQQQDIKQLLDFNKNAKHAIIKQDKILNEVKTGLTIGLKNLQNNANYIKYLQAQKAQMLLYINKNYQQKWNNKYSS